MNRSIYDVLGVIGDFEEALSSEHDKKQAILRHLKQMDTVDFQVQNFSEGLDWLNVTEELSLDSQLKGKLVVLDFFTYCCINCMHILPDLEAVEEEFPASSGVAVIGVHSAKFLNEKVTANITSAVLRYNIQHPVVNDKDAVLWQALAVSCWPTLVFVGPNGQLLYTVVGEGHREKVLEFLKVATEYYADKLNRCDLPIKLEKNKAPSFNLSFPGKVCTWPSKQCLVIADTGNHRVVVTDLRGIVKHIIGNGQQGFRDGLPENAQFSSPQGVACDDTNIFVTDTGNHALRHIRFEGDQVKVVTLAGTGHQGDDKEGGRTHTAQELASPWDLIVSRTPDDAAPILFIAMAGTHQIWVYFLADGSWYKEKLYPGGTCVRFAGSGQEENRNNSYPEKASFAQPSGLALLSKASHRTLYVADSESSSIRSISLDTRRVAGVVGGERDPTNLFAFGDVDGIGYGAKLQHPLGVTVLGENLIVADSYNHKIKYVDVTTGECHTLAGTGSPGATVEQNDLTLCQFNEPGGLASDDVNKLVYIADTNNHAIKVLDFVKKSIYQLPIIIPKDGDLLTDTCSVQVEKKSGTALPDVSVKISAGEIVLPVPVELPSGQHFNTDAPNSWKISAVGESAMELMKLLQSCDKKGDLAINCKENRAVNLTLKWPQDVTPSTVTLGLQLQIFVCMDDEYVCLPPKSLQFNQTITFI